jgi:hypothetical protein
MSWLKKKTTRNAPLALPWSSPPEKPLVKESSGLDYRAAVTLHFSALDSAQPAPFRRLQAASNSFLKL